MSRWKTNFQNHQIIQKIQATLRPLESLKLELLPPAEKIEYERALKVLKLLEAKFSTIDPDLFAQNAWGNLANMLNNAQSYANSTVQNPSSGHLTNLNNQLDEILSYLRIVDLQLSDKEIKALGDASAIYRQKLVEELDNVKKRADEFKKQFDSLSNEVVQAKARVDQNDQNIQQQKTRLDQSIAEFQKQFSAAQEKRGQDFVAELKKIAEQFSTQTKENEKSFESASAARALNFDAVLSKTTQQSGAHLDFLKKREDEVNKIFGAIGTSSFAGNFGNTADKERKAADQLRMTAIALMTAMMLVAGVAFYYSITGAPNWEAFLFRLGTVLVIAVPAFYAANESSKHRERERLLRKNHLELAAIDSYLVLLPEKERNEIKGKLAEKFFGVPEVFEKTENVSKKDLFSLVKMIVSDLTKGK